MDRDGTIYETFDDKFWIYHLGLKGTNGRYDKASVVGCLRLFALLPRQRTTDD